MLAVMNEIVFKPHVNIRHAEEAVAQLALPDDSLQPVRLDFSNCKRLDVTVGWRIGRALRRHATAGLLEVAIPDWDFESSPDWFKHFTRCGLGQALAFHCDTILHGDENIASALWDYYQRVRSRPGPNHFFAPEMRSRPFNVDRFDGFFADFRPALRWAGVRDDSFPKEALLPLGEFVYEAVQNVYDHAHNQPLAPGTSVFDYLCLNHFKDISAPTESFADYLSRIRAEFGEKRALLGYLEIIVCDDGVGMPARQSQDASIYWDADVARERRALLAALETGCSIKFETQDAPIRHDPGFGSAKIVDSLRKLRAFAFLRTGRCEAVFDASDPTVNSFRLGESILGYLPGTTLDVIVPVPDAQLRLLDRMG